MALFVSEYNVRSGRIMPKNIGGKSFFKKPRKRRNRKGGFDFTINQEDYIGQYFEDRYYINHKLTDKELYDDYCRVIRKAKKDFIIKLLIAVVLLPIGGYALMQTTEVSDDLEFYILVLYLVSSIGGFAAALLSIGAYYYSKKRAKEYTEYLLKKGEWILPS